MPRAGRRANDLGGIRPRRTIRVPRPVAPVCRARRTGILASRHSGVTWSSRPWSVKRGGHLGSCAIRRTGRYVARHTRPRHGPLPCLPVRRTDRAPAAGIPSPRSDQGLTRAEAAIPGRARVPNRNHRGDRPFRARRRAPRRTNGGNLLRRRAREPVDHRRPAASPVRTPGNHVRHPGADRGRGRRPHDNRRPGPAAAGAGGRLRDVARVAGAPPGGCRRRTVSRLLAFEDLLPRPAAGFRHAGLRQVASARPTADLPARSRRLPRSRRPRCASLPAAITLERRPATLRRHGCARAVHGVRARPGWCGVLPTARAGKPSCWQS